MTQVTTVKPMPSLPVFNVNNVVIKAIYYFPTTKEPEPTCATIPRTNLRRPTPPLPVTHHLLLNPNFNRRVDLPIIPQTRVDLLSGPDEADPVPNEILTLRPPRPNGITKSENNRAYRLIGIPFDIPTDPNPWTIVVGVLSGRFLEGSALEITLSAAAVSLARDGLLCPGNIDPLIN